MPSALRLQLRMKSSAQEFQWPLQTPFDLGTAANAAQTPVAEVLAIVGQQPVVVLAQARAGAPDDFVGRIDRVGVLDDLHRILHRAR